MGEIVYIVIADPDVAGRIVNEACISWSASEDDREQRCSEQPTPVRLLYFRLRSLPGVVLLEWETAWEVSTFGFYLLRSTTGRLDDAVEIAFVPAAGLGGSDGAVYRYRDRHIEPGRSHTYWLAQVDENGRRRLYRPVSAAFGAELLLRTYLPLVWRRF
jgi:hypothetical protein